MWLSIWRTVTAAHAVGRSGRRWPIVSSRPSLPSSTRCSATAPLKAFAMLAIRMCCVAVGAPRRSMFDRPALSVVSFPSR